MVKWGCCCPRPLKRLMRPWKTWLGVFQPKAYIELNWIKLNSSRVNKSIETGAGEICVCVRVCTYTHMHRKLYHCQHFHGCKCEEIQWPKQKSAELNRSETQTERHRREACGRMKIKEKEGRAIEREEYTQRGESSVTSHLPAPLSLAPLLQFSPRRRKHSFSLSSFSTRKKGQDRSKRGKGGKTLTGWTTVS